MFWNSHQAQLTNQGMVGIQMGFADGHPVSTNEFSS